MAGRATLQEVQNQQSRRHAQRMNQQRIERYGVSPTNQDSLGFGMQQDYNNYELMASDPQAYNRKLAASSPFNFSSNPNGQNRYGRPRIYGDPRSAGGRGGAGAGGAGSISGIQRAGGQNSITNTGLNSLPNPF